MQYCKYLILSFLFMPFSLFAQDITGLWKGTLFNDTTGQYYKYEIGISKEKGKFTGFSHTWFILDDKQYFGVKKVKVRIADDGKILVEDDGLISNNYPVAPNKNVRQLNVLTLDASEEVMKLTGPFSTNRTKEYHSLTGSIELQRKNDFWQSALVPHLQELGRDKELSFVKEEAENNDRAVRQRLLAEKENEASVTAMKTKSAAETKLAEKEKQQAEAKQKSDEVAARKKEEKQKEQAAEAEREILRKQNAEMAIAEKERRQAEIKLQAETKLQTQRAELARKEETKRLEAEKKEDERLAQKASIAKTATEKKQVALEQQQQEADKAIKKEQAVAAARKEKEAMAAAEKEKSALAKLAQQQQEAKASAQKAQLELAKKAQQQKDAIAVREKDELVKIEQEKKDAAKTTMVSNPDATAKQSVSKPVELQTAQPSTASGAPAQNVNERKTVLQQTVSFTSDSLMLSLYDNGEIDGDTVSVLMNGELIVAKQGLSTNAIKKTIYIPANTDRVELIMYAESLGSIPPNTGLLVIRDGKSLYEIRFSGDLQKNASIVFNRKKE